jgi:hypothetical protein
VAACSCISGIPACARAGAQAPAAIFAGQVLDIEVTEEGRHRVQMQVTERFRGGADGRVDVYTGPPNDAGTCAHYGFVPGATYLVYASRNAGGDLTTGLCSGTAPLDEVPETDLTWLRSGSQQADGLGTLQGTVRQWSLEAAARGEMGNPVQGARIIATAEGRQYEAWSDAAGAYQIAAAPGVYTLTVEAPAGLYAAPLTVTLSNAGVCSLADISLRLDGRLEGRVVDARGLPVPYLTVDATAVPGAAAPSQVSTVTHRAVSDAEGRYAIGQLPPGRYAVSIDTRTRDQAAAQHILYPGTPDPASARTIELGEGQRIALANFTLPASLDVVTLIGIVRDATGLPLEGVRVYLAGGAGTAWTAAQSISTDPSGEFRITVPVNRSYRLRAERPIQGRRLQRTDTPAFDAVQGMAPLEIVIGEP